MDFDSYDLDPTVYDEMFLPDGAPREHCRQLYDALGLLTAEELSSVQERVTLSFSTDGLKGQQQSYNDFGQGRHIRPFVVIWSSLPCPCDLSRFCTKSRVRERR